MNNLNKEYTNILKDVESQILMVKQDILNRFPNWRCYEIDDIQIDNYQSHPTIKAPLSN